MRLQQPRYLRDSSRCFTGAAVSTVGTISFVGLIAAHAARLTIGNSHRQLVPLTAILGAILVTLADTLGRVILAPKEIPSGLVTALIGTPYFLWLLIPKREKGVMGRWGMGDGEMGGWGDKKGARTRSKKETRRRQGDKETRRQGDKKTGRRQEDKETRKKTRRK